MTVICKKFLDSHIHFVQANTMQRLLQFFNFPQIVWLKITDIQRHTFRLLLLSGIKMNIFISLLYSPLPQSAEIFLLATELKKAYSSF